MKKRKLKNSVFMSFCILLIVIFGFSCSNSDQGKNNDDSGIEIAAVNYEVPAGSDNWPSFRGVNASGITKDQDLPLKWDVKTGENIQWSYKTPGLGLSAPVIWGDKVFLTTAVDQVADDSNLRIGLYGDVKSVENENIHSWEVICLNQKDGKLIWKKEAYRGVPKVKRHTKSSHANSTPVTDGKHLVAFFGSEGIYCYDFEGKFLWKRTFGVLDSGFYMMPEAQWEFASSPVIHKDVVIIQVDVQKNSFLAALDVKTGKTLWKTGRDEVPTWSTPTIYQGKDQTQIIVNGFKHIGSYNFTNGEKIWWMAGGGDIPVPTPITGFEKVFITNAHGRMRPIMAVNLSAKGEISLKGKENLDKNIAWLHKRKGAYMPTPLLYGDNLYLVRNNGILVCFDAKTGKEIYKSRVGTMQSAYSGSPVAADGKIYFADESGAVHVVKAGNEFKLLQSNHLKESCLSTPAISKKMLFIRTNDHLFAIGKGGKTEGIKTRVEKIDEGEKIDLTKVKTDGSIKDPKELIKIVYAKFKTISSIKYKISINGIDSDIKTVGNAEVTLYGWGGYFPEYIKVRGKHQNDKNISGSEYIVGSDGNEFYHIDLEKKELKKGVEYSDAGPVFLSGIRTDVVNDFVSKDPLSQEKTAKEMEIKGIKEINGESCYEINFNFPQYKYEKTWWFSVKSFLPYKQISSYVKRDGKRGGAVLEFSGFEINQHQKSEFFKIPDINKE